MSNEPRTYNQLVTQLKKDLISCINDYIPNPCFADDVNYCMLLEQIHYHIGKTIYRIHSERVCTALRIFTPEASESPNSDNLTK